MLSYDTRYDTYTYTVLCVSGVVLDARAKCKVRGEETKEGSSAPPERAPVRHTATLT